MQGSSDNPSVLRADLRTENSELATKYLPRFLEFQKRNSGETISSQLPAPGCQHLIRADDAADVAGWDRQPLLVSFDHVEIFQAGASIE